MTAPNEMARAPANHRPARWVPAVATALLVPLFVGLGYWQLNRAEEKRSLQHEYDSRAGTVVRVEPRLQSAEALRFYRVEVAGTYETDREFLLDNRVHQGRVGYHVITPLRIGNSEVRVLVNRGWVPIGESRATRPVIETPTAAVTVTGVATVPSEKGYRPGTAPGVHSGWEPVWPFLDLKRFARSVKYPVQPVVILLAPEHPSGFVREWSRLDAGIAVHQGYAFQWFALALALTTLYFVLRWRRRQARDAE